MTSPGGGIGRRAGLKHQFLGVPVRSRSWVQKNPLLLVEDFLFLKFYLFPSSCFPFGNFRKIFVDPVIQLNDVVISF